MSSSVKHHSPLRRGVGALALVALPLGLTACNDDQAAEGEGTEEEVVEEEVEE